MLEAFDQGGRAEGANTIIQIRRTVSAEVYQTLSRHVTACSMRFQSPSADIVICRSQIAYTASKGAVLAMTRELAVIHAREGIRVNALCPGPLRTELLMKVSRDSASFCSRGLLTFRSADFALVATSVAS